MSILIKGMEMPKCCADCDVEGHYENSYGDEYGFFCPFGYKAYTEETRDSKRLDNCPLVPVPPHGRLIDADADYDKIAEQEGGNYVDMDAVDMGLNETPVIIPDDDVWPEWRTRVLGIRRQEEGIRPGQIWRHFKGGVYRVLYLAKHSETGEGLVIYTKDDGDGTVWARPASMWQETLERDGKSQPRFELIFDSPRENFCADCHWYTAEEQYCFRNGCHAYNESSCVFWEPVPADEPIPAPGGKTVPTTYDLLYEEGGAGTT